MTKVYYCDVSEVTNSDLKTALSFLELNERDGSIIHHYLSSKDKALSLFGRLIVRYRMIEAFNLDKKEKLPPFELLKYGKPFLTNFEHFNISHSGTIVVVAFSNHSIGIDIEFSKDQFPSLIKSYFSTYENKYDGFIIWTLKEAFLKYAGLGISNIAYIHFTNIELSTGRSIPNYSSDGIANYNRLNCSFYDVLKNYKISICRETHSSVQFKKFSIDQLLAN